MESSICSAIEGSGSASRSIGTSIRSRGPGAAGALEPAQRPRPEPRRRREGGVGAQSPSVAGHARPGVSADGRSWLRGGVRALCPRVAGRQPKWPGHQLGQQPRGVAAPHLMAVGRVPVPRFRRVGRRIRVRVGRLDRRPRQTRRAIHVPLLLAQYPSHGRSARPSVRRHRAAGASSVETLAPARIADPDRAEHPSDRRGRRVLRAIDLLCALHRGDLPARDTARGAWRSELPDNRSGARPVVARLPAVDLRPGRLDADDRRRGRRLAAATCHTDPGRSARRVLDCGRLFRAARLRPCCGRDGERRNPLAARRGGAGRVCRARSGPARARAVAHVRGGGLCGDALSVVARGPSADLRHGPAWRPCARPCRSAQHPVLGVRQAVDRRRRHPFLYDRSAVAGSLPGYGRP